MDIIESDLDPRDVGQVSLERSAYLIRINESGMYVCCLSKYHEKSFTGDVIIYPIHCVVTPCVSCFVLAHEFTHIARIVNARVRLHTIPQIMVTFSFTLFLSFQLCLTLKSSSELLILGKRTNS